MPDDPQGSLSDEEKAKQAETEFNNRVNSAVTAQIKRFTEKTLPGLLEGAFKPLSEQLAALKTAPPVDLAGDTKEKKGIDPEIASLRQKLEESIANQKIAADKAVAAEKKSRDDKAFSDFKGHLATKVRPDMLDMVAEHLFKNQKVVEVDDDGSAYFKGGTDPYGQEIRYPLKDGVDNWLKGEAAKPFMPAAGTSNTPPVARRTVQSGSALPQGLDLDKATPQQRLQAAAEMEERMTNALATKGIKVS